MYGSVKFQAIKIPPFKKISLYENNKGSLIKKNFFIEKINEKKNNKTIFDPIINKKHVIPSVVLNNNNIFALNDAATDSDKTSYSTKQPSLTKQILTSVKKYGIPGKNGSLLANGIPYCRKDLTNANNGFIPPEPPKMQFIQSGTTSSLIILLIIIWLLSF